MSVSTTALSVSADENGIRRICGSSVASTYLRRTTHLECRKSCGQTFIGYGVGFSMEIIRASIMILATILVRYIDHIHTISTTLLVTISVMFIPSCWVDPTGTVDFCRRNSNPYAVLCERTAGCGDN